MNKSYLESMPDINGFFGKFGGSFIPPVLEKPFDFKLDELGPILIFKKSEVTLTYFSTFSCLLNDLGFNLAITRGIKFFLQSSTLFPPKKLVPGQDLFPPLPLFRMPVERLNQ